MDATRTEPAQPVRGFEHVEHTADLGIRAWGRTPGEAFAECARGMLAYMIDVGSIREVGEIVLRARADTPDRLLAEFLEEVLFLHQTRLVVFSRFEAEVDLEGGTLAGTAFGESYDPVRHGHVHEIKAITRHAISVRSDPPEVFVIVDI